MTGLSAWGVQWTPSGDQAMQTPARSLRALACATSFSGASTPKMSVYNSL